MQSESVQMLGRRSVLCFGEPYNDLSTLWGDGGGGFKLQAAHSAGEENIAQYIPVITLISAQPQAENLIKHKSQFV